MNHDKIKLIKGVVQDTLHSTERKLLIIYLMMDDEYHYQDVYDIINDVLYIDEWEKLEGKMREVGEKYELSKHTNNS